MSKCLGKKAPKFNIRTLDYKKYRLSSVLPPYPVGKRWAYSEDNWGMFLNDQLGDCTIAAVAHMQMEGEYLNKEKLTPTDAGVLKGYEDICGYVPGNPNTDNGGIITDVLNAWQSMGICGNKISAWAYVNPWRIDMLKEAVYLFGAVDIGIQLPITAQSQVANGLPWTLTPHYKIDPNAQPGTWGGHSVPIIGYGPNHFDVVTWGAVQQMSVGWLQHYVDEAYIVFDTTWVEPGKVAPNGFDLSQLQADINQLNASLE